MPTGPQEAGIIYEDTVLDMMRDIHVSCCACVQYPDDAKVQREYITRFAYLYESIMGEPMPRASAERVFMPDLTAEELQRARGT